mgnify:FL=1
MKYELIIFDIGKTLYDKNFSARASDCVLHDIEALRKKGIKVGVCTMRTIQHCKKVVPVELDFYISLNGSYIICEGEVIVDKPTLIPLGYIDFLSYGKDFTCYSTEKAKILANVNGFLADRKGVASPAYNAVLFDIPADKLSSYDNYTTEYWANTATLSLQDKNTSRVIGIQEVLRFYNTKLPLLYFGDGPNDSEIFQSYHDCICMGDGYSKLKQYALFQTKTCRNEGVSFALRKLGLLP